MRNRFALAAGLLLVSAGIVLSVYRRERVPAPDADSIVTQVRRVSELATVKYTVQKVVALTEQKQPVGSESILLIVQATVTAGVDLSELRPEDVTANRDSVTVRLPPAKIVNIAMDEKETKVWDRSKTWWTPWVPYSLDFEQRARITGLEAVKKTALEMGILAQATQNAETSIRSLLELVGVKSVIVVPRDAS